MNRITTMMPAIAGLGLLAGCATVAPDRSFGRVQTEVTERLGVTTAWPITQEGRAAIDKQVQKLLADPIDKDRAVAIALLNNRSLRAEFARVGLAEADFVEAGLLENPSLSVGAGFPDRSPSGTGLDFGITLNVLRVLTMPARRDIAGARLDAEVLAVADEVLQTAANTRTVFLDLQAAEHTAAVLREVAVAAETAAEFARRVHEAGNISDLALANEESLYEQSRLEYADVLAEVADRRERLNVQLGLWGDQTGWTIADRLPELPALEPDLSQLESLAVHQRLDLAAAAKRVESIAKAAGLQRDWRYLLSTQVGVNAARDTDGQWIVGPEVSIELPIFSQRQGEILSLDSALLAAESDLEAVAIETRSDVRRLRDRLYAARYKAEHYRDTIVPLRERITQLTQQQYNYMLADTFDLLAAKREGIQAYRDYLNSVHDYWAVRSELERAVGGRLPEPGASPAATETPQSRPENKPDAMPDDMPMNKPASTPAAQPAHQHGGH